MNRKLFLTALLLVGALWCSAQVNFDHYFLDKTLRIDYVMGGDAKSQTVFFKQMKQEPHWGGSKINLVDIFNYGTFRFKVLDKASGTEIYSKGFNSLFQEWQTTAEAKNLKRAFYQVNVMPFPRNPVRFVLESRRWDGSFEQIFEMDVDPKNYFVGQDTPSFCKSSLIMGKGDPSKSVDVAFIAEGYTKDQMDKFRSDVKRIAGYIFDVPPFDKYKKRFNIYALESASQDSGTDIPGEHIYRNTVVNSSFYTFDIDRYLTTFDIKSLHDIAANVPYDQIFVLINTDKYGGGGFYNYYTSCSSDNKYTYEVSSHEFGHGFVGLADEYYTSSVAYENFYNLEIEPWEPNITTMVNFDSKWKDMIKKKTPVPTPREKKYEKTVGVFEGGGYLSKGVYSPHMDCKMKSNQMKHFCPVCERAAEKMIKFCIGK